MGPASCEETGPSTAASWRQIVTLGEDIGLFGTPGFVQESKGT